MQIHPSDLLLQETFQNSASRCRAILDHLDECERCQKRLRDLLSTYWTGKSDNYDVAFDRSFRALQCWQQAYAKERAEAPSLYSALLDHPDQRQELLLRNHPRFQTWGLLELLLRRSRDQVFQGPADTERLARLALTLSDHIDSASYGPERIEDLRAEAWAQIANSHRARRNLPAADEAFASAMRHLRRGTGDVIERATLLNLKATLRRFQRRFAESCQLLERAIDVFREAGEHHSMGRSLISLAILHHVQEEWEPAILRLKEALPLLDSGFEPRTVLCALHNLIDNLASAGRFMEARGLLAKALPFYQRFPEPWAQSRLKWVEGKIALGFGHDGEAKTLFRQAYEGLIAAHLPEDAALVSPEFLAFPAR